MQLNDTLKAALDEATAERARLDALITSLTGIVNFDGAVPEKARPRVAKTRKGWSESAKKAARKRMKLYWADRHAKEG